MVKPRTYWLSQEHPVNYQELTDSTQELRLVITAYEYFFSPLQITNNKEGQKSQNQEPEPEPLVSRLLGRPASYHNHFRTKAEQDVCNHF